jgi:hypothetical protein
VGDALHGPPAIGLDGKVRKAYLLSQIDGATRYVPHSYFAFSEGAACQEYGFKQAISKHGLPRTYYVDLGSAYIAESLVLICAELGIRLLHTGVQDCEAKGVIERWHRTWREEVGDELPPPLPLAGANAKHWAWLAAECHARKHDTTGRLRASTGSRGGALRTLPRHKNSTRSSCTAGAVSCARTAPCASAAAPGGAPSWWAGRWSCGSIPRRRRLPARLRRGPFRLRHRALDRVRNASRRRLRLRRQAARRRAQRPRPLALIEQRHYQRVRPVGAPPRPPDDPPHKED